MRVVVVDTETTGLSAETDYVCEVVVRALEDERPVLLRRVRPPVPMPEIPQSTHGITDADLVGCPTYSEVCDEIAEYLQWAEVIVGYNPDFDLEMLRSEHRRATGKELKLTTLVICLKRLWDNYDPPPKRHLQAAFARFVDPAGFEGAHGALADVDATIKVLRGQFKEFKLGDNDWPTLDPERMTWVGPSNHLKWEDEQQIKIVCNFGKNKGKEFSTLEWHFLKWILEKDFPPHVKQICEQMQKIWKQKIPRPDTTIALWAKERLK